MSSAAAPQFWHSRGWFPALPVPRIILPSGSWAVMLRIAEVLGSFLQWCRCSQRWEFGFFAARDDLHCSSRDIFKGRISFLCSWHPARFFSLRTSSPPHFNPKSGLKATSIVAHPTVCPQYPWSNQHFQNLFSICPNETTPQNQLILVPAGE